jgi:hypothetical protein
MKLSTHTLAPIALLALTALPALGWNQTGHMVIAAIARRDLKSAARREIERLLSLRDSPYGNDMLSAACWADDTKTKENGRWHFINYHFRPDGGLTENKPDEENVVWAIKKFVKVLGDKAYPDDERADALRYILHFVGDVHQPLHAAARDTDERPEGDRGGNAFPIAPPAKWPEGLFVPDNLHALWDAGCGLLGQASHPLDQDSMKTVSGLTDTIRAENPRVAFEKVAVQDFQVWAQESLEVAKTLAYQLKEGSAPSAGYLYAGREASAKRIALAGYRLADLLNKIVK